MRVEDHGRVGAALVLRDPVDDRVAADLLLAVARDPHVDGERALGGERRRRLQLEVELPLVVGDPARVEPLVADRRLERRALPEVERIGRLDVEVPVDQDGRRGVGVLRGANLADRERPPVEVDEIALAARAPDEVAEPLAGGAHVGRVRRVGADARNAQPLRDFLEPGRVDRHEREG